MGFNDYKIRDGKLIPNDAYRKGWNEIFGKKKKAKPKNDWAAYEYYNTEEFSQKENEEYLKQIEPLFKGDN